MYKNVVLKAFKKAEKVVLGKKSKTNIANFISEELLNQQHYQLGGKTLSNLFDDSKKSKIEKDISVNSLHIQHLCIYLGYNNYEHYLKENPHKKGSFSKVMISFFKANKIMITLSGIIIILVFIIVSIKQQRWMLWQDKQYIEVSFDVEKYDLNQLKIYKKDRINNFKQITPSCDTTPFFNQKGYPKVWYGKNTNGDLEYFTDIGLHPKTGKTLKPITKYMIEKYICKSN